MVDQRCNFVTIFTVGTGFPRAAQTTFFQWNKPARNKCSRRPVPVMRSALGCYALSRELLPPAYNHDECEPHDGGNRRIAEARIERGGQRPRETLVEDVPPAAPPPA